MTRTRERAAPIDKAGVARSPLGMPIFHIEVLGSSLHAGGPVVAKALADALGARMEAPPGHTWVRIDPVPPSSFAESGEESSTEWVFARVMLRALPEGEALARLASDVTDILARGLHVDRESVHVVFEPPVSGRIAFGGELAF